MTIGKLVESREKFCWIVGVSCACRAHFAKHVRDRLSHGCAACRTAVCICMLSRAAHLRLSVCLYIRTLRIVERQGLDISYNKLWELSPRDWCTGLVSTPGVYLPVSPRQRPTGQKYLSRYTATATPRRGSPAVGEVTLSVKPAAEKCAKKRDMGKKMIKPVLIAANYTARADRKGKHERYLSLD